MLSSKVLLNELRQPLVRATWILTGVLVISIAAGLFNARMLQSNETAKQMLQDTVLGYRNAIDSELILRTKTDRFGALRAEGFIGPEPRLRWIEDVREIAERADIVSIRYELGARKARGAPSATGAYQLYASPMQLRLTLRHEGDLLTFLGLLEGRRGGLFELSSCSLVRLLESGGTNESTARVAAECNLLWYSLDTPGNPGREEFQ